MNRSATFWTLVAVGALVALMAGWALLRRPSALSRPNAVMTEEEKAYLSKLAVVDERMSAAENFIGDTITYLDAQILNEGAQKVRAAELRLEFVDTLDQVVLRETAYPVTVRLQPLEPGKSRPFQVSFDHMPADWNRAPPRITVTRVKF